MLNKNKEDLGRVFRMLGLAVTLPMLLLSGPLVGYLLSEWLIRTWHLSRSLTLIFVLAGFAGSLIQAIKILKLIYQESQNKEKP